MSLPLTIFVIVVLIIFSAICSGLNISLMALDPAALKRKALLGNKAAGRVLPLRRHPHLALTSILLTNIAAVSATSLVLEHRVNGFIAGAVSTLLIVIFGEVVPQAFFAKNALVWTSRFAPVLELMIFFTYPISKPLALLLDKIVGQTQRKLPSRQELGMIITEHLGEPSSELDEDEIAIIRGALMLSQKRVRDIYTPIEQVYWLTPDTVLSEKTVDEIISYGYSRVPICNAKLTHCFGILLTKDLLNLDDNDQPQVKDVPLHPVDPIGSMTALDTTFRRFITAQTHLIPVEREDEIIGVVSIEDLIEEIVGREIEDENDRRRPSRLRRLGKLGLVAR